MITGVPERSRLKLMSELFAAFWWISTARMLSPATRFVGLRVKTSSESSTLEGASV